MEKYDVAVILAHELNADDNSLSKQTRERTDIGIRLFKDGEVKNLLMSGGHEDFGENYGLSIAEAMKRYALSKGILNERIFVEDASWETVGGLIFCKIGIIDLKQWKRIIFVSHEFHLPRVRTITGKVFGEDYQKRYKGISSELDSDRKTKDKEKKSEITFRESFGDVKIGDDNVLLVKLFEEHECYKKDPNFFRSKFERLKNINS